MNAQTPEQKTLLEKIYRELTIEYRGFGNYTEFAKWLNAIPEDLLRELIKSISTWEELKTDVLSMNRATMDGMVRKMLTKLITEEINQKAREIMSPTGTPPPPRFEFPYNPLVNRSQEETVELYNRELENHERRQAEHYNMVMNMKLQRIHEIYSLYIPMLDLFRIEHTGKTVLFKANPSGSATVGASKGGTFQDSLKSQINVCDRLKKEMDESLYGNPEIKRDIKTIFQNIHEYTDEYAKEIVEYNRRRRNTLLLKTGMNRDVFRLIVPYMSMDPPPLILH